MKLLLTPVIALAFLLLDPEGCEHKNNRLRHLNLRLPEPFR